MLKNIILNLSQIDSEKKLDLLLKFSFFVSSIMLISAFYLEHWWHASRTLYRDSFAGIDAEIGDQVEFGLFKKLGDETTRRIPGRV